MAIWDAFLIHKNDAKSNNYKLDLFETVAQNTEVADMSTIKRYFNKIYDNGSDWNAFGVDQRLDDFYAAEITNKIKRLQDYRSMAMFPEIASALDTIVYSAVVQDENNAVVTLNVKDPNLEANDIQIIKQAAQEYFDLFDFDNNFGEYFRKFVIEGQLCWENVVAKDDTEQGIIDVNFIPSDAYEFCYDIKARRKFGIMITNLAADMYNIATSNGISNIPGQGPINVNNINRLNCYQELQDQQCLVLPFEQLTYVDSGIYSADNKYVFSPLERARRAYNQLMLIEDAILIYRMVRAPQKYVFNVDVGKMGNLKGQQKVAQLMKQFSTKKTYDPSTGTVGKAYDPMQMTQNFWFVKGADSEGITVNTLTSSHNFGNLDDLEYFYKKLLRSLNIPIARYFEANAVIQNNGGDAGISAEEYNFAKFIISLQQRFALGVLDGLITHLKLKGLWDVYKLTRSKLDVIFTPPIEYDQYKKQKRLQSKVTMLKTVLGEQGIASLFSEEYALTYFMGWDKDRIKDNADQKFREKIKHAQQEAFIQKIKESGNIDVTMDGLWSESLKDILQKDLEIESSSNQDEGESKEDEDGEEFNDEGGEMDIGGDESNSELDSGEEGGLEI